MAIDRVAAAEIDAAFAAAQRRTDAPLFCVVAQSSADYALAPALAAAALALATPWPLLAFSGLPPARIYLVQLGVFCLAAAALAVTRARVVLASRAHRRSACFRAAVVQFVSRGLSHAPARNGALLYVSLAERYARIVADVGLGAPHEAWRAVVDELTAGLAAGDARAALTRAAARIGDLLAQEYPAAAGREPPKGRRFQML